jgi:hypothetical protein
MILALSFTISSCITYVGVIGVYVFNMFACGNTLSCDFYVEPNLKWLVVYNSVIGLIALIYYITTIFYTLHKNNLSFLTGATVFMVFLTVHYTVMMTFIFKYGYIILWFGIICEFFQVVLVVVLLRRLSVSHSQTNISTPTNNV